jgi:hypothetical protein
MSNKDVNRYLIERYLSDEAGLQRLHEEYLNSLATPAEPVVDEFPEVDEGVLALAREARRGMQRRFRRELSYVPLAFAASVLVAVIVVKGVFIPPTPMPHLRSLALAGDDYSATIMDIRSSARTP